MGPIQAELERITKDVAASVSAGADASDDPIAAPLSQKALDEIFPADADADDNKLNIACAFSPAQLFETLRPRVEVRAPAVAAALRAARAAVRVAVVVRAELLGHRQHLGVLGEQLARRAAPEARGDLGGRRVLQRVLHLLAHLGRAGGAASALEQSGSFEVRQYGCDRHRAALR